MNIISQDYFSILEKEGILNTKIGVKLKSLIKEKDKRKYFEKLLETKRTLIILYNQTIQLKLNFPYNLNHVLKNIEELNIIKVQNIINLNIKQARGLTRPRQKRKRNIKYYDNWRTKSSVRSISTPMYS